MALGLKLIYAGLVAAASFVAFGGWGVPLAVLVLLHWWLADPRGGARPGVALVMLFLLVGYALVLPVASEADYGAT